MSVTPSWRAVREDSRQGFGTTKHPETHPLEWCWSVDVVDSSDPLHCPTAANSGEGDFIPHFVREAFCQCCRWPEVFPYAVAAPPAEGSAGFIIHAMCHEQAESTDSEAV